MATGETRMRSLSLEEQRRFLLLRFPKTRTWTRIVRGRRHLCFDLSMRPTAVSACYRVMFAYARDQRPSVWVLEPELVLEAHGEYTPHLYQDGSLCLYDAAAGEWLPHLRLVDTIVPWALRWLFHYEHWLVFGEWLGNASRDEAPGGAGGPAEPKAPLGDTVTAREVA